MTDVLGLIAAERAPVLDHDEARLVWREYDYFGREWDSHVLRTPTAPRLRSRVVTATDMAGIETALNEVLAGIQPELVQTVTVGANSAVVVYLDELPQSVRDRGITLTSVGVPKRVCEALRRRRVTTVDEVLQLTAEQVRAVRHLGETSFLSLFRVMEENDWFPRFDR